MYANEIDYDIENDRRYVTGYHMPNDENEQDRLAITHQVYLYLFDDKLTTVPLDNPSRIIDIGTGTGEWAIDMGERYPNADVIGTDISAIQSTAVPPNVFFEIDNAENEWPRTPDSFDLIHMRNMRGSFKDWNFIYRQSWKHLRPGGWVEIIDFDDYKAITEYFPPDSQVHEYLRALGIAFHKAGRPMNVDHLDPETFAKLGLVDVRLTDHKIPIGTWPDDPKGKSTGKLWLLATLDALEAASLRLLTQELGWQASEVSRICDNIGRELKSVALNKERAHGLSVGVKVLVGRKPTFEETATCNGIAYAGHPYERHSVSHGGGHHDATATNDEMLPL